MINVYNSSFKKTNLSNITKLQKSFSKGCLADTVRFKTTKFSIVKLLVIL